MFSINKIDPYEPVIFKYYVKMHFHENLSGFIRLLYRKVFGQNEFFWKFSGFIKFVLKIINFILQCRLVEGAKVLTITQRAGWWTVVGVKAMKSSFHF